MRFWTLLSSFDVLYLVLERSDVLTTVNMSSTVVFWVVLSTGLQTPTGIRGANAQKWLGILVLLLKLSCTTSLSATYLVPYVISFMLLLCSDASVNLGFMLLLMARDLSRVAGWDYRRRIPHVTMVTWGFPTQPRPFAKAHA